MKTATALFAAAALQLAGCASAPDPLPEHTILLGEVARIASREELLGGFHVGSDKLAAPAARLKRCGFADADLQDGRFALVHFYDFWHSLRSGLVRGGSQVVAIPPGTALRSGSLVEIEVTRSPIDARAPCAAIHGVRTEA